jgi:hypothetical protein
MSLRGSLKELHHRNVFKVAVAYAAAAMVLLEVLTHLLHNFEAPHWVLKVTTTLLIAGLPPPVVTSPRGPRCLPLPARAQA